MSDSNDSATGAFLDAARDALSALTQEFARAWQLGLQPNLDEFLARAEEADRDELTRRLVSIEVAFRRAHGEEVSRADYQPRYPCLSGSVNETIAYAIPSNGHAANPADAEHASISRHRAAENLLFGILGWQMDFIRREDLVRATREWTHNKQRSLAELLIADGRLNRDDARLLWELVNKHVEKHGGSLQRSLAAVSSDPGLQQDLAEIKDQDVSGSLGYLLPNRSGSSNATMSYRAAMRPKHPSLRYIPLRPYARGGLGEIFVAYDSELGREVALKEIQRRYADDHTSRSRFVLEGEITGGLEHPGIVSVYGLGIYPDGRPYYAMQLIRGESLKQAVERFHKMKFAHYDDWTFELRQLLERFKDICHTIEYAHSRGVLHRDLKPSNIMLGRYGETLVIDWGLAKPLAKRDPQQHGEEPTLRPSSGHDSPETMIGSAIGTPAYMSPEQARGRLDEISFASDIFSLGATLYTIVTDRAPYHGKMNEKIEQARTADFAAPRTINPLVPRALEAVCLKAMALAPEARYSSCRELAVDIERWLAGESISAYREPLWQRGARWLRRHRTQLGAATVVLLTLVALLATWQWREQQRVRAVSAQVAAILEEGERLARENELAAAQLQFTNARARVVDEPALADLLAEAQTKLDGVEVQLAERASRAAAASRLEQFHRLRDDAVFHGTLLPGTDLEDQVEATLTATAEALALYGVTASEAAAPQFDRQYYTAAQQRAIEEQCYELVLLYASALARPRAGLTADEQIDHARTAAQLIEATKGWAPDTRARFLRLADCRRLAKQPVEAQVALELARQQQPSTAMDFFLVGDSLLQRGEYSEAFRSFGEALRIDARHFWAQYFAAVALLELDQPAGAIAHLTAAESQRPFVWIPILRGSAQGRLGNTEAAEREFALALSRNPAEYGIYLNRGAMRLEAENYEAATEDLQRAIQLKPRQYQAYLNLGEAYRRQQKFDEALAFLHQAVELAPQAVKPYFTRAQVYSARAEVDAALADFDAAIERAPHGDRLETELYLERGKVRLRAGQTESAIADFDEVILREEHHTEAHRLRAEALLSLARGNEALPSLSEVVRYGKPSADVLRKRGMERAHLGEFAGAIADYTDALELEPQVPLALARRGWAYLNEAYRLALADFDAAIALEPKNGDLYCGRGFARVQLGLHKEAVEDAEMALRCGAPEKHPRAEFAIRYNAAAIYAQASVRASFDELAEEGDGSVRRFQARAVELLRAALAQLPDASRKPMGSELFRSDEALAPLRTLPDFQQLLLELSSDT